MRTLGVALIALALLPLVRSGTASATEYTHILEPGQRLYPGDTLYSPNHSYRLIMQGDGNLVIYHGGSALWSTRTNGHGGANAVMQGDGNFVVYQSGHALWNSHTDHHGGANLDMQDDGNLVIREAGNAIWATHTEQAPAPAPHSPTTYTHILEPGQRLYPGDTLYSPNHSYRLIMQGDGNLVLYHGGSALWSTKTNGHGGANAVMQGDGNFVVYQSGHALWNSNTDHHGGANLDMQDDGNLVIRQSGNAIWATHTEQAPAPAPHSPTTDTHILDPGQRLYPGDTLYSPNHSYRLIMQGDGNLVLYHGGSALWSTRTNGHGGANAVMQGDGNFVVYQSGHALWNSNTDHHGGAILHMQNDGNLVIYWHGKAIWSSKAPAASHAEGVAIAWAKRYANAHNTSYNGACLRFVFEAYSAAGVNLRRWVGAPIGSNTYPVDIWGHFNHGRTGRGTPPYGALVFWKAANGNRTLSHVALSLGRGRLVSTSDGVAGYTHYERVSQHRYAVYQGWWLPDR